MADRSILVVEDDSVILSLLTVNFEMEGFAVSGASDGDAGLAAVHDQKPDLVITDVMMPKRSGLDLLAAMRSDERIADIPVILLSAKAQAADVRAGLDAGADDYVTKPFEPDDLVERVTRLLDRFEGEPTGEPDQSTQRSLRRSRTASMGDGLTSPPDR